MNECVSSSLVSARSAGFFTRQRPTNDLNYMSVSGPQRVARELYLWAPGSRVAQAGRGELHEALHDAVHVEALEGIAAVGELEHNDAQAPYVAKRVVC